MGWKGSIDVNGEEYMITDDYDTREEAEEELETLLKDFGDESTNNWRLSSSVVETGFWYEEDDE